MRQNTEDKTLERNYVQKWRFLIHEYREVKAKRHPKFRFVSDFYHFHGTNRQTFLKYYNRFQLGGKAEDLCPRKRGPKWKGRGILPFIEQQVLHYRRLGNNRYEIEEILVKKLKKRRLSASSIYRICRRYGLNRLRPKMKANRRKIIKERAGQLAHIDCHHLSQDLMIKDKNRYYLVCVIDDCTRIAWAEVVKDIKALTVMFATLRSLNMIAKSYGIHMEEVMTDNGSEFSGKQNQSGHPFERMLHEMGIKHRYTRPYRPQTNGKVERFWRTLNEDLIEGTTFDSFEHLEQELFEYLVYYNDYRLHQALGNVTPKQFLKNLSAN